MKSNVAFEVLPMTLDPCGCDLIGFRECILTACESCWQKSAFFGLEWCIMYSIASLLQSKLAFLGLGMASLPGHSFALTQKQI